MVRLDIFRYPAVSHFLPSVSAQRGGACFQSRSTKRQTIRLQLPRGVIEIVSWLPPKIELSGRKGEISLGGRRNADRRNYVRLVCVECGLYACQPLKSMKTWPLSKVLNDQRKNQRMYKDQCSLSWFREIQV